MKINKATQGKSIFSGKRVSFKDDNDNYMLKIQDEYSPGLQDDGLSQELQQLMKNAQKGRASHNRDKYRMSLNIEVFTDAIIGGVTGMGFLGNSFLGPLGGIALGTAAGVYFGWDKIASKDKGNIEIDLGDKKFNQTFYYDPYSYDESPDLKKALESIKEKVMPLSTNAASDLSGIDREKLEALKSYSDKLIDLGKKRRLVADFGEKSKNEKEALHIIDSNMAKDLIASGKSVFIVNGEKITETPRKFTARASNQDSSLLALETHDMLEKQIDYTLSEVKIPEDLEKISDGKGVPEGMLGIYKDANSYKETVYRKSQSGYGEVNGPGGKGVTKDNYSMTEKSAIKNPSIKTTSSNDVKTRTAHYWNMPAYATMGASIGTYIAANALGGGPAVATPLMLISGFVTYNAAKRLMRNNNVKKRFEV